MTRTNPYSDAAAAILVAPIAQQLVAAIEKRPVPPARPRPTTPTGSIAVVVAIEGKRVRLRFPMLLNSVGFTKAQALVLAYELRKYANQLEH